MHWETSLQPLLLTTTHTPDAAKLSLLRIHQRTLITLLEDRLDSTGTALDAFHWAFDDVLDLIAALQTPPSHPSSPTASPTPPQQARSPTPLPLPGPRPLFVLDAGLVFALYWTALKCRDGGVRRRAIGMLEGPCAEGVWGAGMHAAVAKRVVEIEEGGVYEEEVRSGGLATAEDVPPDLRVGDVRTEIMPEGRVARVVVSRYTERRGGGGGCESVEWVRW